MSPFALYFTIYKLCGIWRPTDSSRCFKAFYNIYSALSLFGIYSLMILELTEILTNTRNADDFTSNSFLLLMIINICFKIMCVLRCRNRIIELIDMLVGGVYKARDSEEIEIQEKFNNIAWSNSRVFLILVSIDIPLVLFGSLFSNLKYRILPARVWLPYSLSSLSLFWISYVHQCVSLTIAAYINVTTDLLITSMMIQICTHFEILKHRLTSMNCKKDSSKSNNGSILEECIRHHNYIIRLAANIKREFNAVITFQLFVTAVVFCSDIFKLSTCTINTMEFYSLISYTLCTLFQLLLYCWHGNEVLLKSIEIGNAAYNMDWTVLSLTERKNLSIIIQRTSKPIIFKTALTLSLSLDTYMSILKVSYSTFNFLQQTSME